MGQENFEIALLDRSEVGFRQILLLDKLDLHHVGIVWPGSFVLGVQVLGSDLKSLEGSLEFLFLAWEVLDELFDLHLSTVLVPGQNLELRMG